MLREKNKKRVNVVYFKSTGETYRMEEEYVVGEFSQRGIVAELGKRISYKGMDYVILDGGDGVRPFIQPHLHIEDKKPTSSRGF